MTNRFLVDDFAAADAFVKVLPPMIKRERFSIDILTNKAKTWSPEHVVLAEVEGKIVAMADAFYSDEKEAANGSLVALRGHGAYALQALLKLKREFPSQHWQSCLREPTAATVGISFRFFDATYDQATWEISQVLMERLGPDPRLQPTPIIANQSLLKHFDLPPVSRMDMQLKKEIVATALAPSADNHLHVNGSVLDASSLMALSFDIANIPYKVRQNVTRLMIVGMGALAPQIGDPAAVKRIVKPRFLSKYRSGLESYLNSQLTFDGCP
ncbi:hypothetical protein ACQU0X_25810 [Pseudovibrio ascidiaceicola]|uniref:hypothetical protein n=1 Tax=Pseudovibrio ascidiaceicola TaxID=285279 RepID=UPI0006D17D17